MKLAPITPADLSRSVIAVPPLARRADLSLDREANRAIIRHLEGGGVRSIMYGGNANFYHLGVSDYAETVDMLAELAGADTWVLPSAGPDFGKLMDQAAILRARAFPTAMLLPMTFPFTDAGLADGVRRFCDALGKPVVVYIKADPLPQARDARRAPSRRAARRASSTPSCASDPVARRLPRRAS